VLDGMHVLFIGADPGAPAFAHGRLARGGRFPAYCTANGKALLAQLPA